MDWFNSLVWSSTCPHKRETPTSRVPTEKKFSDFIINKDEETIGECTKPPGRPVDKTKEEG